MASKNTTLLRYPGGKSKMTLFIKELLTKNKMTENVTYVEPFAGGAGIALNLLIDEDVKNVIINDKDISVYAFWWALLNETNKFIEKILQINVDMEEWYKQREIQKNKEKEDLFDLGFSTFFLNRTNRSGIISAGPIGGLNQSGKWKIDARFKKLELLSRIQKIVEKKGDIKLFNKDAVEFLIQDVSKLPIKNVLIYLDPPYYNKGKQLYMNFFKHEDHQKLEKVIEKLQHNWVVSYDDTPEIREIYKEYIPFSYQLNYSLASASKGNEVMYCSENIQLPRMIS